MTCVIAGMLAELKYERGDLETAIQTADEALTSARARNDQRTIMVVNANLSSYLTAMSQYDEARRAARESLAMNMAIRSGVTVCWVLQHFAAIAAFGSADFGSAARLLGYIEFQIAAVQGKREYTEASEYDRLMSLLRSRLQEDQLILLMREGSAWNEEQAVAQAKMI
ncbi:MAG TPA: hypothetical protein VFE17_11405 [Candidatus Baltobacteraceae bacterium]|jgi:tetratricopeptide (TPR) repeat protein|nr:hypothetical protein [Candidatus Baltobacteraceae bacterium]